MLLVQEKVIDRVQCVHVQEDAMPELLQPDKAQLRQTNRQYRYGRRRRLIRTILDPPVIQQ